MQEVITQAELADLLGISTRQAGKILHEVNEELRKGGYIVLNTRPPKAPRTQVMKRLGLMEEQ